jgi:hypothetical protein
MEEGCKAITASESSVQIELLFGSRHGTMACEVAL